MGKGPPEELSADANGSAGAGSRCAPTMRAQPTAVDRWALTGHAYIG